jgi:hypothetical protein
MISYPHTSLIVPGERLVKRCSLRPALDRLHQSRINQSLPAPPGGFEVVDYLRREPQRDQRLCRSLPRPALASAHHLAATNQIGLGQPLPRSLGVVRVVGSVLRLMGIASPSLKASTPFQSVSLLGVFMMKHSVVRTASAFRRRLLCLLRRWLLGCGLGSPAGRLG